jgi:TolB-like protein
MRGEGLVEPAVNGRLTMKGTSQMLEVDSQTLIPVAISEPWSHEEVREELKRILRSRFFIKSMRLSCFLSTAVDYLLEGKADRFKEYTVGTEVYRRPSSYDPTQDTIVRTEARRLRTKLREYYSTFPEQYRVRIALATGSYVPVIEMHQPSQFERVRGKMESSEMPPYRDAPSIAVIPFCAKMTAPSIQELACNLEEELTHELATVPNIKVFRGPIGGWETSAEQVSFWNQSGVRFALLGHLRPLAEGTVVQIQLTTMQGMILWSGRFSSESIQARCSEIASAVRTAALNSPSFYDGIMQSARNLSH